MLGSYKVVTTVLLVFLVPAAFADHVRAWPKPHVEILFDQNSTVYAEVSKLSGAGHKLRISEPGVVKELIMYRGTPVILDEDGHLFTLNFNKQLSPLEYWLGGANLFTTQLATDIERVEPLPREGNYFLYRSHGLPPIRLHTVWIKKPSRAQCEIFLDGFRSPGERMWFHLNEILHASR